MEIGKNRNIDSDAKIVVFVGFYLARPAKWERIHTLLSMLMLKYRRTLMSCWGPSWSWSYGSWNYNYLCNQYLSPLTLWVRTPLRLCVLGTTLCDTVCQRLTLSVSRWFSPVSSTNKADHHDITEILLKENDL